MHAIGVARSRPRSALEGDRVRGKEEGRGGGWLGGATHCMEQAIVIPTNSAHEHRVGDRGGRGVVSSSLRCQNGAVTTAPTLCSAMCRHAKSTLHGIRFGS
jgi:hypothetical protein